MKNLITLFVAAACLLPITQQEAFTQSELDLSPVHAATWLELYDVVLKVQGLSPVGTLSGLFPQHPSLLIASKLASGYSSPGAGMTMKDIDTKDYTDILRPKRTEYLTLMAQGNFLDTESDKKCFFSSKGDLVCLSATDSTVNWSLARSFPELLSHGSSNVARINHDQYDDYVVTTFFDSVAVDSNYCRIVLGAPTTSEMRVIKVPRRKDLLAAVGPDGVYDWKLVACVNNSEGRTFVVSLAHAQPYFWESWRDRYIALEEMVVTKVTADSATVKFILLDTLHYFDASGYNPVSAQIGFNYPELKKVLLMTYSMAGDTMFNIDNGKFTKHCTFSEKISFINAQQNVRMSADGNVADVLVEAADSYCVMNGGEFVNNNKIVFRGKIMKYIQNQYRGMQLSYLYPADGKNYFCVAEFRDQVNPRLVIFKLPVVGVDEQGTTVEQTVQPNPARVGAEVTLTTEQTNQSTIAITLVTIEGREIRVPRSAVTVLDSTIRFVVPNVATGVYHVQCTNGKQTHKYKLVVID